jgi:CheY-like chemotaxis protein
MPGLGTMRRSKVLLVEDEILIAMDLEEWLTNLGFEVVGPFKRNSDAIAALDGGGIDFAVLDYVLADEKCDELADRLTRLGVPYVFLTGSHELLVNEGRYDAPILEKPISRVELTEAFAMITASAST